MRPETKELLKDEVIESVLAFSLFFIAFSVFVAALHWVGVL